MSDRQRDVVSYKLNNKLQDIMNSIIGNSIRIKNTTDQLSSGNVSHHKAALQNESNNIITNVEKMKESWQLFREMLVFLSGNKEINAQFERWKKKGSL